MNLTIIIFKTTSSGKQADFAVSGVFHEIFGAPHRYAFEKLFFIDFHHLDGHMSNCSGLSMSMKSRRIQAVFEEVKLQFRLYNFWNAIKN